MQKNKSRFNDRNKYDLHILSRSLEYYKLSFKKFKELQIIIRKIVPFMNFKQLQYIL